MALLKRTLNNVGEPLVDANGVLATNTTITFQLIDELWQPKDAFDATTKERVVPTPISVVTDEDGEFTVDLWPCGRATETRYYLCRVEFEEVSFFRAVLAEDGGTLKWSAFKSSGGDVPADELSAFQLHAQDSSIHLVEVIENSSGMVEEPIISDLDDGSITVSAADCVLYADDIFTKPALRYSVVGATFLLTDLDTNYLIVDYSSGIPVYDVTLDVNIINGSDIIPVNTIYRDGVDLHFLTWDSPGQGLAEKMWFKDVKITRFSRESGIAISENPSREFAITAGVVWNGSKRNIINTVDSAVDEVTLRYHISGVWTSTIITQFNNTSYDDGTDLVSGTAGYFLVNWVYSDVSENGHAAEIILGNAEYGTLGNAELSQPPTVPEFINTHHLLVGRIIVEVGASSASSVASAFVTLFSAGAVTKHNDLSAIQGGTADEHYHLTAAEYTALGKPIPLTLIDLGNQSTTISMPMDNESNRYGDEAKFYATFDGTAVTFTVSNSVAGADVELELDTTGAGTIVPTFTNGIKSANSPDIEADKLYMMWGKRLSDDSWFWIITEIE